MLAKKFKLPVGLFPRQSTLVLDSAGLSVRAITNNLTHNRVGIVFKKGAFKTAALRNKLKRIVFDFFRENWSRLEVGHGTLSVTSNGIGVTPAPNGTDLLVTLKPAIIGFTTNKAIKDYLKTNVILRYNTSSTPRKRPGSNL